MNNFSKIGRHAASVFVGQLAIVGFGVVDNAIAGHIDKTALAALSLGVAISLTIFIGLIGIVQAILPIAGQLYGAKRYADIGYQFRQSLYLAVGVSIIGILLLVFPEPLLYIAQVEPEKETIIRSYLRMMALGFTPAILFRIYTSISQAISRPWFVTWLQIAGLIIKAPLSWFLAVNLEMGIMGCALSTVILNFIFVFTAIVVMTRNSAYLNLQLFKQWDKPSWTALKDLLKLGVPMGLSYFIEVTGTTFMALFIARFHSDAFSAGHQIITQLSTLVYMIPLSLGIAGSAVVSQYIGARNLIQARSAGNSSILMSLIATGIASAIVLVLHSPIIKVFSNDPAVFTVAVSLTLILMFYLLADALQITTAFILRSYKIAILPTVLYAFVLWGIGISGGYIIAFNVTGHTPPWLQGPSAFWLSNAVSLTILAVALMVLYNIVSKRRIAEAIPNTPC